jgi:DNA-binding transcriptional LysR family regulator
MTSSRPLGRSIRRHEFSDLFSLMAVAETKSFTSAAVALDTSQSKVSHAILRLERTLGETLILRNSRGVQGLTPLGERLVRELGQPLETVQRVMAEVA